MDSLLYYIKRFDAFKEPALIDLTLKDEGSLVGFLVTFTSIAFVVVCAIAVGVFYKQYNPYLLAKQLNGTDLTVGINNEHTMTFQSFGVEDPSQNIPELERSCVELQTFYSNRIHFTKI
jgi:hypothetical protein